MEFKTLCERYRKGIVYYPERLLCIDPGNTIGWCLFEKGELTTHGQLPVIVNDDGIINYEAIAGWLKDMQPTHVVMENYRVYAHKLEQHTFSDVSTIRIIGFIEGICKLGTIVNKTRLSSGEYSWETKGPSIPVFFQMAQQAKGFCTDEKLKEWGYWKTGMRHSRDAIRHGCYWMLFQKEYR